MSESGKSTLAEQDSLLPERSLDEAIAEGREIVERTVEGYGPATAKAITGLSGGNDSTTTLHFIATHAADLVESFDHTAVHINTTVGLTETRDHAHDQARCFGCPLIEACSPDKSYADVVRKWGFPGPAAHQYAYSWLKERAIRSVRKQFVRLFSRERMLLFSGARAAESVRRMGKATEIEREGNVVWVNPLLHWSHRERDAYMERFKITPNPVTPHLHISGECLCGSHAQKGERELLFDWYPHEPAVKLIQALEAETGEKWGQGGPPASHFKGRMCHSCVGQQELAV